MALHSKHKDCRSTHQNCYGRQMCQNFCVMLASDRVKVLRMYSISVDQFCMYKYHYPAIINLVREAERLKVLTCSTLGCIWAYYHFRHFCVLIASFVWWKWCLLWWRFLLYLSLPTRPLYKDCGFFKYFYFFIFLYLNIYMTSKNEFKNC